jgi:hypothetical protein
MNRISRMGVLLFLVSVAPGALGSAQAPPVEELTVDITSAGLVKKVRAAVGDESAWSAVRTLRVTGTIDFAGQTLAIDGIESQGDLTVTTLR